MKLVNHNLLKSFGNGSSRTLRRCASLENILVSIQKKFLLSFTFSEDSRAN